MILLFLHVPLPPARTPASPTRNHQTSTPITTTAAMARPAITFFIPGFPPSHVIGAIGHADPLPECTCIRRSPASRTRPPEASREEAFDLDLASPAGVRLGSSCSTERSRPVRAGRCALLSRSGTVRRHGMARQGRAWACLCAALRVHAQAAPDVDWLTVARNARRRTIAPPTS